MTDKSWLEALKPGDTVIVLERYEKSIKQVKRLTKTQIILKDYPLKFNRSTGFRIGGSRWDTTQLIEPTDELITKIKKADLVHKVRNARFSVLTTDQLEQIVKWIDAQKEGK